MTNLEQEQRSDPLSRVFPKVTHISCCVANTKINWGYNSLYQRLHFCDCAGDEVHLPQVRSLGHGAEVRRALCSPLEHHQREDLRLPLVLVRHPCHHHWHSGGVNHHVNYFSNVWSTRNGFNVFRRYGEHDILTAGCVQSVDLLPAGNAGDVAWGEVKINQDQEAGAGWEPSLSHHHHHHNHHRGQVARICRAFTLGDWFLLYQLGKNIDPIIFRFIKNLINGLEVKRFQKPQIMARGSIRKKMEKFKDILN